MSVCSVYLLNYSYSLQTAVLEIHKSEQLHEGIASDMGKVHVRTYSGTSAHYYTCCL